MSASISVDERREHFADCVQRFGGTTAFSRRLGIDERAIRRFINCERPLGDGLLEDTRRLCACSLLTQLRPKHR